MPKINETWKDIPGYEGVYKISTNGSIQRISKARGTVQGYIFSPSQDAKGYLRTRLTRSNGISSTVKVHRLVAMTFHPLSEFIGAQVNHIDGNKQNNFYLNLEWVTNKQNAGHAKNNGLLRPGNKGKFGADHNRSIPLRCVNIDSGEELVIFGINEAARRLKTNSPAIWRVLSGEYKHTKRWVFSRI